ncbi:hypothetical protein HMI55_005241 [Coelomomyces lativittatus]|nr:hypothetical protein HMI56_005358 [Coelomomyces lativittatus]KAJ1497898.1 hypothetical protein HMI55_005241 [Coelomomyces lativittatus]
MKVQLHTIKALWILLEALVIICKTSVASKEDVGWSPILSIHQQKDLKVNANYRRPIHLLLNEPYIDFSMKNVVPIKKDPSIYPVCVTAGIFSHGEQSISILLNGCKGADCYRTMRSLFFENNALPVTEFDSKSFLRLPLMVKCQYFNALNQADPKSFEWRFDVYIKGERLYIY